MVLEELLLLSLMELMVPETWELEKQLKRESFSDIHASFKTLDLYKVHSPDQILKRKILIKYSVMKNMNIVLFTSSLEPNTDVCKIL